MWITYITIHFSITYFKFLLLKFVHYIHLNVYLNIYLLFDIKNETNWKKNSKYASKKDEYLVTSFIIIYLLVNKII